MATILYVDRCFEDGYNRKVYEDAVQRHGHTLTTAKDGKEALEVMCAQPVDLCFVDLVALTDRVAFFGELKKINHGLPVVICSVDSRQEHFVRSTYPHILGFCRAVGIEEISEYLQMARERTEPVPNISP